MVRDTFTVGKMDHKLKAADKNLATQVSELYNATLDDGEHPNVKAFFANTWQKNEKGELVLALTYLNPGESPNLLKTTIAVGKVVLDVFQLVSPKLID